MNQTDSGRPGDYSISEAGTALTLRQESGSSLNGSYTATASGSDAYGLQETGFSSSVTPVSETLDGADNSTLQESGNALTGDLAHADGPGRRQSLRQQQSDAGSQRQFHGAGERQLPGRRLQFVRVRNRPLRAAAAVR